MHPSGLAPVTHFDGFDLKLLDDFTGNALDPNVYAVYNGTAKASQRGPKSSDLAIVHDGMLTLRVAKVNGVWTGSGLSVRASHGTYGKYRIRARYSHGKGVKSVALLWPEVGWPPEIDFMEFDSRDPDHSALMFTNHYGTREQNFMQHASVRGDWTQWHTFAVTWTPDAIKYGVDGHIVATQVGHVPDVPMWLGISNNLAGGGPDETTPDPVDLDIDWITYHALSPTS